MNNNNNNILLVIRHPVGGIKSYLKYVYKTLYFDDFNITVLLTKDSDDDLSIILSQYNINLVYSRNSTMSLLTTLLRLLFKYNYSLVHSQGFTSGICVSITSYFFTFKHLMTSHDILQDAQFRKRFSSLKKYLITYLFNRIDVIHSVSNDANQNLRKMLPGLKCPRFEIIFNGIDSGHYLNSEPRGLRNELNLSGDFFLIGFMGRFMSQKGFRDVIGAIEIINDQCKLNKKPVVLAFGYGGFIREDREIIEKKGLKDYFIFMPNVTDSASTIKGLDAIVMPSLWEACPLLPMECLIAGTPLIASNCIGLREVINGSPAFVVKPSSPAELAVVIQDCMLNNRKQEFVEYQQTAVEKFDVRSVSIKLSDLYRNILSE